ncbi:MAG: hypothetical protein KJ626_15165 [Verrucomicrobia bacterium]|nr:hypothetical protein [Verrucomicrobiota bacterium]
MVLLLVILCLVVLWSFDVHKILFVKTKARNAGDAAAVAAARWQGISLNLIGELNVLKAVSIAEALSRGETNFVEAAEMTDLQSRLSFVGPMIGFAAAQQAAKNNGIYANEQFSAELLGHASTVELEYPERYPVQPYENTPSPPTAWDDYAEMIMAVASEGVAVRAENAQLYRDYENWGHPLLNPDFYDAAASGNWCWFLFNALSLLETYSSWLDWPALPIIEEPEPTSSEYFGLGLTKVPMLDYIPLTRLSEAGGVEDILAALQLIGGVAISSETASVETDWFCYNPGRWRTWNETLPDGFPFLSDVKPEYDYAGADAAVRIETDNQRLSPGMGGDVIVWTAAAKPFGYLDGPVVPDYYGLVLPAFHEARLIPIDASSAPASGSQPGWGEHVYEHLEPYMAHGPPALDGSCWYCNVLLAWENAEYRQAGLDWLDLYSHTCTHPGGSGPGGGTRRGH